MNWFYRFLLYVVLPVIYPLTNILLPKMIPFFRKRREFEWRNLDEFFKEFNSERQNKKTAAVAFEISSEGELEQVRPLIKALLEKGLPLEIVFCSPSVENAIVRMRKDNPHLIRIFRLPLLTYFPYDIKFTKKNKYGRKHCLLNWITAKTLVLCRYDFFPELMLYGQKKGVKFILLSATVKDKRLVLDKPFRYPFRYLYWKWVYTSFDNVITATTADEEYLGHFLNRKLRISPPDSLNQDSLKRSYISSGRCPCIDLRVLQINERVKDAEKKLSTSMVLVKFKEVLEQFSLGDRIIFGSFWALESKAFQDKNFINDIRNKKILVTIVPHVLEENHLQEMILTIKKYCSVSYASTEASYAEAEEEARPDSLVPIYLLKNEQGNTDLEVWSKEWQKRPGIIVLAIKGVLCELYTWFRHAYVGGGHGRSIHSVLEPYLAGARIYVGPKVFRSTEFDLVQEASPDEIHIVKELESFYSIHTHYKNNDLNLSIRRQLIKEMQPKLLEFMKDAFDTQL